MAVSNRRKKPTRETALDRALRKQAIAWDAAAQAGLFPEGGVIDGHQIDGKVLSTGVGLRGHILVNGRILDDELAAELRAQVPEFAPLIEALLAITRDIPATDARVYDGAGDLNADQQHTRRRVERVTERYQAVVREHSGLLFPGGLQ